MTTTQSPTEISSGPSVHERSRVGWIVAAAAVLVLAAIPVVIDSGFMTFLLTQGLAMALPVLGVTILMRGGLVTFGHALFFAAGAYTAAFAFEWWGFREITLVLVVAALVGAATGALLGLLMSRYRGIFFGMFNLAFSMILYSLLLKFFHITGGSDGLGVRLPTYFGWKPDAASIRDVAFYFTLVVVVIAFAATTRSLRSPLGAQLAAIRDNEVRVEYLGSSVRYAVHVTYVIAAVLAAIGGVLAAYSTGHVLPEMAYWTVSGQFVFIALLGGFGKAPGALLGAIAFAFLESYVLEHYTNVWQLILGAVMFLIIAFLPGGLWSALTRIGERMSLDVRT
jgi:ABC-type branched-subunit amino acid transport system permease subunit